mgnify:CR=1 FL=1
MFPIWTPVKVVTPTHPRVGQAGTVRSIDPAHNDSVGVVFDSSGVLEAVQVTDLQALA